MRITLIVHPNSRTDSVEKQSDGTYFVKVKAPADKGKANAAVVKLLSKQFSANVRIVSGLKSHNKVVEIG